MFMLDFTHFAPPVTWASGAAILYSHGALGISSGAPFSIHERAHAIGERISVGAQSISLRTWNGQMGGMSVSLSGLDTARWVANNIPRGDMALLKVGFPGWDYSRWQTVSVGQYRGLSGRLQDWTMEFVGIDGMLQSARPDAATFVPLFANAGEKTATVSGGWSVGSALVVTDAAEAATFEKDSAGDGLIYCEPTTGDPFYVKWSSLSVGPSDTFTLRNRHVLGTARVAMAAGDTVTNIGYVSDEPRDVIRRLLTSGASAPLTTYGTLPESWGYGLGRSMFNEDDLSRIASTSHIDATFVSDLIVPSAPDDPYSTFQGWMRKLGYWLVWKEDGLSFRFAFNPTASAADLSKHIAATITDTDVVSVDGFQLYAPDAPVEYERYWALTTGGAPVAETPMATAPAVYAYRNGAESQIFDEATVAPSNRTNANNAINARLAIWYHRVPCSFEVTLRGWHFAGLVPGDYVRINSSMIPDLYAESGTIDDRAYMVTASSINWAGVSTRLTLATIRDKSTPTS